jgi:membrane-associated phospholipid phosphatase
MRARPPPQTDRRWYARRYLMRRSAPLRAVILGTLAAVAIVIFIRIAHEMVEGDMEGIDRTIALAIHRLDTRWLVSVMVVITNLGSGFVLTIVSALVAGVCVWRHERRLAVILAANGILILALELILKHVFGRARPTLFPEISLPADSSFPSGHSMGSMAIYGTVGLALSALYPEHRRLALVVTPLLIATIGFSRIFLGVHWPSDVAAGFAAGVPFVLVARYLSPQELTSVHR